MTAIVVAAFIGLIYIGRSYYLVDLDQRFFQADYNAFKPSGSIGHGLGILGSFLMLSGVFLYMARKRIRKFSRIGILKHWLEFHIFLCTLGPLLILFHTSFKFGGLVAISFWSMVAVALSGVIGRFIYLQIPKTIEGRAMSLSEIEDFRSNITKELKENYPIKDRFFEIFETESSSVKNRLRIIKDELKTQGLKRKEKRKILKLFKSEITLNKRIKRLKLMQKLFEYWHVVHLPFAILMIVIMIVHIGVTLLFGYRWIF
ncbi:MAG: hypothetical protein JW857_03735 [Bacteroidales bacterium]|nr:hypothetical protein [Bacteroidales bacterium]